MVFGREDKVSPIRITTVQYSILVLFLVLGFGLWRLQVAGSDYYSGLAERNRIRTVPILAPRGKILDREGRIIVDNYPSFSALLLRDQTRDVMADVDKIAAGLHMDPKEVRDRISKFRNTPQYQPLFLKDDITPDELAFIESHRNEIPELDTIMAYRRLYPKYGFLAHAIGYVGEVSEDMLNMPAFEFYRPGDIVGKSGVEQYYNDILMGKDGSRREVVDSRGRVVDRFDDVPAEVGKQLRLTIDLDIQVAAEQALEGKKGAIIAMDPKTGEILALVSRPTFDPNQFAVRLTRDYWNQLITDEGKPLMNKAIQAQLAPGSVFKIIMATAGTQEGIAQDLNVNCGGGANFYGRYFKCWVVAEHRTHGSVNLPKAIYQSCDVYFYTLAERLGIGRIAKWATLLGMGQKTYVDLPQEVSGVMPSEEWKIRNFKQKWYAGETISVGIGQGAIAATPIQLMRAISAITMDGKLVRPHIVTFDNLPDSLRGHYKEIASKAPEQTTVPIDEQSWTTITDAMSEVVNPIGTAPSAHLNGIDFGGKTGSAQTISNAAKARLTGDISRFRDNGWFVGVSPRRNPDIIVAVLIEQGEHGYLAARAAAQVIKAFVEKRRKVQNNYAYATPPGYVPPAKRTPKPAAEQQAPSSPAAPATGARNNTAGDVEIAGIWAKQNEGHDDMASGRFRVTADAKPRKRVAQAPGVGP